jgi:hypothetical protein
MGNILNPEVNQLHVFEAVVDRYANVIERQNEMVHEARMRELDFAERKIALEENEIKAGVERQEQLFEFLRGLGEQILPVAKSSEADRESPVESAAAAALSPVDIVAQVQEAAKEMHAQLKQDPAFQAAQDILKAAFAGASAGASAGPANATDDF